MKTMNFLLGVCLVLLLSIQGASAQKRLTILHLNDTHSHLEPERSGREMGLGGVIERAAYKDSVVKADGKRNVLLLHAGDFSQGTSYFPTLHGDIEIDVINALGYDCVTLGNHEFDNGLEELARRLSNMKCPVVCANYDFSDTPIGKYVKPYTIVRKAGMKIGIIGLAPDLSSLVTKETSSRMPALGNAEVVNKWAALLKDEYGCDLVIVLSHLGFTGGRYIDPVLVRDTRNLDIIVGGHSHTNLKEAYIGKNLDGRDVVVVQDGCWGLKVGNLKVIR
jgi:5''-nucleotidase/2'',3''-cyclic phosphodiesterase and related esterases